MFLVFTEENAFKDFLLTNIAKFRNFLFFCDHTGALKNKNLLKIVTCYNESYFTEKRK